MDNLDAPPVRHGRQIPSLDGLRAFSVLFVMALHTIQAIGPVVPTWMYVLTPGSRGVFIFFVISGYLITTLLLREQERTGRISLVQFYIRRAFRILPPLYLYICVIALLGLYGHMPGLVRHHIMGALTFTNGADIWSFEHFWSLRLEEQFYLIWPVLLVFFLVYRKGSRAKSSAAWVAAVVIAVVPIIRVFCFLAPSLRHSYFERFQPDGLMFGALGALLQGHPRFEAVYRRATLVPWLLPVLLFGVSGALSTRFQNYWDLPFGFTMDGCVTLMWLLWLVRNPETVQGRVMNYPAIAWLGRLSYSLYIWQTLFLNYSSPLVFGHRGWWDTFPTSWLCILAVGTFSFYCIEQPALRLRDRVMRKKTPHPTPSC